MDKIKILIAKILLRILVSRSIREEMQSINSPETIKTEKTIFGKNLYIREFKGKNK